MKFKGPRKPAVCFECKVAFLHKEPRWREDGKEYHRIHAPKFKMATDVINQIVAQRRHA